MTTVEDVRLMIARIESRLLFGVGMVTLLCGIIACGGGQQAAPTELQRVHAGVLDVVLLAEGDSLKPGKGSFVLEFRDGGGVLVDVGTVRVSATMSMPGMTPMFGTNTVMPSPIKGRYEVASDLGMAGTWRFTIEWDGPAGRGSTSLSATAL